MKNGIRRGSRDSKSNEMKEMRWDEENREEMKSEAAGCLDQKISSESPDFSFSVPLVSFLFFLVANLFIFIFINRNYQESKDPSWLLCHLHPLNPPFSISSYLSDKTALSETRNRHESSDPELGASLYSPYIQTCESYPLYSNYIHILFILYSILCLNWHY